MRYFIVVLASVRLFQAQTPAPRAPIRWAYGVSGAESFYRNGKFVEVLREDGVEVHAAVMDTGKYMRAEISVENHSSAAVDVLPQRFSLVVTAPKIATLKFEPPEVLERMIRRRAAWASLGAGMGAISTKTATSTSQTEGNVSVYGPSGSANGTYSATTTTKAQVPDEEARARSRAQLAQIHANAQEVLSQLNAITLRANTVKPGLQVGGAVFFSREKKHDAMVLRLPVGEHVFDFEFHQMAKK